MWKTYRTFTLGLMFGLSGCGLGAYRAAEVVTPAEVQHASPCVRQFMVDYARTYNNLLTHLQFKRAVFACRLLATVQREQRGYPADGCIGEAARRELHATPAQRLSWLKYFRYTGGTAPSVRNLLSWASLKQSCLGKLSTESQVAALDRLKNTPITPGGNANS